MFIRLKTAQGEFLVPFQPGANLRDILIAAGFHVRSACSGKASCGQCLVWLKESRAIPYTPGERLRLSLARLDAGWRLACQINPDTNLEVSLENLAMPMSWRAMREEEFSPFDLPLKLASRASRYGLAIDLGTTHIRMSVWDIFNGKRLSGRTGFNPQAIYGADVLNRVMEANRSKEMAFEIAALAARAIGEALRDISLKSCISLQEIGEVLIVGNTAMMSLLSGMNIALLLQPEYWTQRLDVQPEDTALLKEAFGLNDDAAICFIPPLGGFIGSDLLAGIISTGLMRQPAGSLLIDFGTNSEIALWDGQKLRVTSTAGGPAFEGCGISCGMPAEAGAIYRLKALADGGCKLSVLGDGKPRGLCGSGLIDAVAWLRLNGKLDKLGRYSKDMAEGFVLSETEHRIVLKPCDIDVLQRAKASIGAGVGWLCDRIGLSASNLSRIYVCGAFGRLLDIENAKQIGLLPGLPIESVRLEGNSALAGCEALLLSADRQSALDAVFQASEVYNLAESESFEGLFVKNLYIQPMSD